MDNCSTCSGSGECTYCNGTGSMKENNPHPDPHNVDGDTGEVTCSECNGSCLCNHCDGRG